MELTIYEWYAHKLLNETSKVSQHMAKKKKHFVISVLKSLPQGIRVRDAALVEQQVDELAGVHARVGIGIRDHRRHQRDHQHLCHRVLAQLRELAVAAPEYVRLYEYRRYATLDTPTNHII